MTAIDTCDSVPRSIPAGPDLLSLFRDGLRAWRLNREEHRALARISRMDPHLIRDMGFSPDAIYDAVEGTWNEVPGRCVGGIAD